MTEKKESPAPSGKEKLQVTETAGVRFTNMVIREFSTGGEAVKLTDFQKRMCQNYFIVADSVLKAAEEKRLKKPEAYRDKLPMTWANVNMEYLARSVVGAARIGYDPSQKNHVHIIPYKNNGLEKWDLVLMDGYRGMELKAMKYGLDYPKKVIVEVVCKNDTFEPLKRDSENPFDTYKFKIKTPFDRGEIVGGFYYYLYDDSDKNLLMFYSLHEIEKRKPSYASPEFWGGERDKWEKDKTTGKNKKVGTEKVEGWFHEMVYKTLCRIAYGNITIDSQKIDDAFLIMQQNEAIVKQIEEPQANKENLIFEDAEVVDDADQPEAPEVKEPENKQEPEKSNGEIKGPGF